MRETLAPEMKKKKDLIVEHRRIWWQKIWWQRNSHIAQIRNHTCCHKICHARLDLNYSRLMY